MADPHCRDSRPHEIHRAWVAGWGDIVCPGNPPKPDEPAELVAPPLGPEPVDSDKATRRR